MGPSARLVAVALVALPSLALIACDGDDSPSEKVDGASWDRHGIEVVPRVAASLGPSVVAVIVSSS